MNDAWNGFINGYCKVDFLCYQGAPNWLGWFNLIVLGVFVALIVVLGLSAAIEREVRARKIETINKREKLESASEGYNLY